jgi:hypothetical protein
MTIEERIEQLNQSKVPIIVFDKKSEQFRGKVFISKKTRKGRRNFG